MGHTASAHTSLFPMFPVGYFSIKYAYHARSSDALNFVIPNSSASTACYLLGQFVAVDNTKQSLPCEVSLAMPPCCCLQVVFCLFVFPLVGITTHNHVMMVLVLFSVLHWPKNSIICSNRLKSLVDGQFVISKRSCWMLLLLFHVSYMFCWRYYIRYIHISMDKNEALETAFDLGRGPCFSSWSLATRLTLLGSSATPTDAAIAEPIPDRQRTDKEHHYKKELRFLALPKSCSIMLGKNRLTLVK